MPPVGQVGQVLNSQVDGRQVNLNLNLGVVFYILFLQEGMLPTPSYTPIQTLVGAVVGALPRRVGHACCLPSRAHRLASPTSPSVACL